MCVIVAAGFFQTVAFIKEVEHHTFLWSQQGVSHPVDSFSPAVVIMRLIFRF